MADSGVDPYASSGTGVEHFDHARVGASAGVAFGPWFVGEGTVSFLALPYVAPSPLAPNGYNVAGERLAGLSRHG